MDKVSVIIPAYNASSSIDKCLSSICKNENKGLFEFEVIVVNDGSIDNTAEIVKQLATIYPVIKLINQPNSGPASARKHGIDISTGNYLAFCDSDDWVEPNWLSSMYVLLKENDADFSVVRAIFNDDSTKGIRRDKYIWNQNESRLKYIEHKKLNGTLYTKLFKKELFNGLQYDTTMNYCEDDYLLWQILHKVHRVVREEHPLYHLVTHEGSLTTSKFAMKRWISTKKYFDMIINDCKTKEDLNPLLQKAEKYRLHWYFSLMKLMIRDSFYDEGAVLELQNVFRSAGLSSMSTFDRLRDKIVFIVSNISVPFTFIALKKFCKKQFYETFTYHNAYGWRRLPLRQCRLEDTQTIDRTQRTTSLQTCHQ